MNIQTTSLKSRSPKCWGRSAQIQIIFPEQEESQPPRFSGRAYPNNIIRISSFCSDLMDAGKPTRPEVPFKIAAPSTPVINLYPALTLRSIFG